MSWRKFSPFDADIKPGRCHKCKKDVVQGYYLQETQTQLGKAGNRELYYHRFDAPFHVRNIFNESPQEEPPSPIMTEAMAIFEHLGNGRWTGKFLDGSILYAEDNGGFLYAGIGNSLKDASANTIFVAQIGNDLGTQRIKNILEDKAIVQGLKEETLCFH